MKKVKKKKKGKISNRGQESHSWREKIQWPVQQRAEEMLVGNFRTPHKNCFFLSSRFKINVAGHLVPTPWPAIWIDPGETVCTCSL